MVETPLVPSAENLARDAILKSMLDNVSEYERKYPNVHFDVFKQEVLKQVIDATFDPKVQLRGFLRTFADTPAFQSEFNILDDLTKKQISDFKDGTDLKSIIKNGFQFPDINPNVVNALTGKSSSPSLFIRVRDFFLRGFVVVARPVVRLLMNLKFEGATARLKAAQATKYAGGPKIYEDESQKKVMDVSLAHSIRATSYLLC